MSKHFIGTSIIFLTVGCASNPDKIQTAYVSPLKYDKFSCDQIISEMDYIGQKTTRLYQSLQSESTADSWQMGVGLLLFWPSLFFLEGGDGPEAAEYAQLKGEFEALRQASVKKTCGGSSLSPEQIIKQAETNKKKDSPPEDADSTSYPAMKSIYQFEAKKAAIRLNCSSELELLSTTEEKEIYSGCSGEAGVFIHCDPTGCKQLK